MLTKDQILKIEEILKLKFKNVDVLNKAFIHRSYLNESEEAIESNERMEFLGDSILQFLSSEALFHKHPNFTEGELTNLRSKIVNTESLAEESLKLGFSDFLFISKGESQTARESKHILANTFEAILGAIYLEHGVEACRDFLNNHLFYKTEEIIKSGLLKDYKSLFQEYAQEEFAITPNYRVISESGPDHSKNFTIGVFLSDRFVEQGSGASKRAAQQEAAKKALVKFKQLELP